MKYYLTFGQQSPFRNGWVEVEAASYRKARTMVYDVLENHWSMLYEEKEFEKEYFPLGKIGETLQG